MKSISSSWNFRKVVFFVQILIFFEAQRFCVADPTYGFTLVQFTAQNRRLQKPYDKAPHERYSDIDGVETFWIDSHDKPFQKHNPTRPRSEIRVSGYDYTSGVWQFEGNFLVPQGTSGATIMQIFGSPKQATTLQLAVYNGDLKYYRDNLLAANIYNKWVRLNVIHNVSARTVTIFINGERKLVSKDHGRATFYFKYGVYGAVDPKNYQAYVARRPSN
ncbi:hypothetical protein ACFX2K_034427 [Malus domestica]